MYAIVRTGGKQYRVEEGRYITVEKLHGEEGDRLELKDVLLIADDGEVTVGTPMIEGARVVAEVQAQGRSKKIIVFKYKAKVRARKKTGHRQAFTRLGIQEILRPGQEPKTTEKPKRSRKAADEEEAETQETEAIVEAPEAPTAEVPKRRGRKKTEEPAAEPTAETPVADTPKARGKAKAPDAEPPAAGEAETKPKTPRRRTVKPKTDDEKTE